MSEVSKVVSDRDRARLQFEEYVIELAAARGQEDDVIDKLIIKVNEAFDVLLDSHVELVLSLGEDLNDEIHENFLYEASDERDKAVEEAEEERVKTMRIAKEKIIARKSFKVGNPGLLGKKDQEEFFDKKLEISRKVSQEVAEGELFRMFSDWANSQVARPVSSFQDKEVPQEISKVLSCTSSMKQGLPSIPEEILDGELAKSATEVWNGGRVQIPAGSSTEILYGASGQIPWTDSYDVTAKTTSRELRCEDERAAATAEHVVRASGHAYSGDTRQSCRSQLDSKRASGVTQVPTRNQTLSRDHDEVRINLVTIVNSVASQDPILFPYRKKVRDKPGGNSYHAKVRTPRRSAATSYANMAGSIKLEEDPRGRKMAEVLISYKAEHEEELSIKETEIVAIVSHEDVDMWVAESEKGIGLIPSSHVWLSNDFKEIAGPEKSVKKKKETKIQELESEDSRKGRELGRKIFGYARISPPWVRNKARWVKMRESEDLGSQDQPLFGGWSAIANWISSPFNTAFTAKEKNDFHPKCLNRRITGKEMEEIVDMAGLDRFVKLRKLRVKLWSDVQNDESRRFLQAYHESKSEEKESTVLRRSHCSRTLYGTPPFLAKGPMNPPTKKVWWKVDEERFEISRKRLFQACSTRSLVREPEVEKKPEKNVGQDGGRGDERQRIHVAGLEYSAEDSDLQTYFSKWGNIKDAVVIKNAMSGKARGFGYVSFVEPQAARDCIKMKEHIIKGRKVALYWAKPEVIKRGGKSDTVRDSPSRDT